jgi:Protein of unknown function (DUF3618)
MADPGGADQQTRGAVAVQGTVADGTVTEGTVAKSDSAKNDPDALVAQIEHTREDLARTIDALAHRVSPASNVRMVRSKIREQLGKREVQMGAAAAGAVVVGLAVLSIWARRRHR